MEFSPENCGKIPILTIIFFNSVGEKPPTSNDVLTFGFVFVRSGVPGDSSRDLFIPDRWRSLNHVKGSRFPKKVTKNCQVHWISLEHWFSVNRSCHCIIYIYPYHPCKVYLPTLVVDFMVNVGKYTIPGFYGIYCLCFALLHWCTILFIFNHILWYRVISWWYHFNLLFACLNSMISSLTLSSLVF